MFYPDLREDPLLLLLHLAVVSERAPEVTADGRANPLASVQQHLSSHRPPRPPSSQLSSRPFGGEGAIALRHLTVRSAESPVHEGRRAVQ